METDYPSRVLCPDEWVWGWGGWGGRYAKAVGARWSVGSGNPREELQGSMGSGSPERG